jgi:hypothetical protein
MHMSSLISITPRHTLNLCDLSLHFKFCNNTFLLECLRLFFHLRNFLFSFLLAKKLTYAGSLEPVCMYVCMYDHLCTYAGSLEPVCMYVCMYVCMIIYVPMRDRWNLYVCNVYVYRILTF